MNKAYKYRLYPNKTQEKLLLNTFGCTRFIYNKMLADKIKYYHDTGKKLDNSPAQYKEEYPWLKNVDSLALANAQMNLNKAYKNFFKNPKHFGLPKFKSKKDNHDSYSTNNQKGSVRIEGEKIKLPKIGWVKFCLHRPIMENSTIKTVTISRTPTGKYYVSILVEYENQILPIVPHTFLGLDFAMHGLYVASDEPDANYPGYYRKAQKQLARAQRKLSRKQEGSKNRAKQKIRVAKIHEKVAFQRKDFLFKAASYLVNRYDVIGIEDISVKAMAKRKKGKKFSFGKSVADNGWNIFVNILTYKLAWQGKQLIKIDKWFPSSQLCHKCGYQNKDTKNLSIREWNCPNCGTHHNRDKNAAINIRNEAKRLALAVAA